MTGLTVPLRAPDVAAFAPFGRLLIAPETAGDRALYSDALIPHIDGSAPMLHVNYVEPKSLPITATSVERHPHAAQCFVPLDVSRYVVMVMPQAPDGAPDLMGAMAFLMPPSIGVIFNPGVWHMGATVLDRTGHFTVLMWRDGGVPDDEFVTIQPVTLIETS